MTDMRPHHELDHLQMRLLKVWQVLDMIQPQTFKTFAEFVAEQRTKMHKLDTEEALPWSSYRPPTARTAVLGGKNTTKYYHVPLGFYQSDSLFDYAEEVYDDFKDLFPKDIKCLAFSMIVKESGVYEPQSASFSPFSVCLSDICAGRFKVIYEYLDVKTREMGQQMDRLISNLTKNEPLTQTHLDTIFAEVKKRIDIPQSFLADRQMAEEVKAINDDAPFSLIAKSFYKDDLSLAKHLITTENAPSALRAYLRDRTLIHDSLDFLSNHENLEWVVRPRHLPASRWPSPDGVSLNLLQQAAVNAEFMPSESGFQSGPISAINGPPGTGKTTLLRDVIAQVITNRARVISRLEYPGKGFVSGKRDGAFRSYSALHPSLQGYEILVVSSNNKAVENISEELPKTSVVSDEIDCRYFAHIAEQVYGNKDTWGLIAAVLGRKKNVASFFSRFWENAKGEPCGMQARLHDLMRNKNRTSEIDRAWQQAVAAFKSLDTEVATLTLEIDEAYAGNAVLNETISAEDHKKQPIVSEALHRARAKLFAAGLHLHQTFITHQAEEFYANISAFNQMRKSGQYINGDQVADLWAALFMIVPVISTTFASVQSMLKHYPEGRLGWLLIDEAGQASPSQAVGAILRAKNVLVVGDPLQLQPIFPLPDHIGRTIFDQYGLGDILSPLTSVQSMADAMSDIYHQPEDTGRIGSPLLVHRRCESPMFEVSNKVAYGNQMIRATPWRNSAIRYTLGPSQWVDVRPGFEGDRQWNPAEWEAVRAKLDLLRDAMIKPDIYILSPFRAVANHLKTAMRQYLKEDASAAWFEEVGEDPDKWTRERIGTVHTSQGRESEAVFAVMGAPKNAGARLWAGSTPNLANVMVSRAKSAIYVFGALKEWNESHNAFSILAEQMTREELVHRFETHDHPDLDLFRD